jgi:hypothetical protein
MTSPRQGGAMSAVQLTGAQRRPMQKLAERVDRVTRVDGLFFERWLDRQRRKPPPIPPGLSHTPEIEVRLRNAAGTRP